MIGSCIPWDRPQIHTNQGEKTGEETFIATMNEVITGTGLSFTTFNITVIGLTIINLKNSIVKL